MATKQSAFFKGMSRTPVGHPHKAGHTTTYLFTHIFSEDVNTTDVLELFPVIPYGRIVEFTFNSENIAATNFSFGKMSGTVGDKVSARTCGTELASAAAAGTQASATLVALAALAKNGDTAYSIGMVPSANIALGATKKLHVRVQIAS
jgi:hypothetical protein